MRRADSTIERSKTGEGDRTTARLVSYATPSNYMLRVISGFILVGALK